MKNNTIKEYLQWITKTNENLIPYDVCFKEGNKKMNLLPKNEQNYCCFYAKPYLIFNAYELLNLFYRYKFEKDPDYIINEKQLKNKLLKNFNINLDLEPQDTINKIYSSKIFSEHPIVCGKPLTQTYFELLRFSRNCICHSDFNSKEYFTAYNCFDKILEILQEISN